MFEVSPPGPGAQVAEHELREGRILNQFQESGDGPLDTVSVTRDRCRRLNLSVGETDKFHAIMSLTGSRMKAQAGYLDSSTLGSTGSQAVTGLGFEPQILFFTNVHQTVNNKQSAAAMGCGATDGTAEWAQSFFGPYLSFPGYVRTLWDDTSCILSIGDSTIDLQASIISLDADGFTIDVTTANSSIDVAYLAIYDPGGAFSVGTGIQDDATVSPGFEPDAMIFASTSQEAPGFQLYGAWSFGGAGNGSDQCGGSMYEVGQIARRYWSSDSALTMTGSGETVLAEMFVDDWDAGSGDVSLDWTTTDAGGRPFGWAAFKTHGKRPCGHLLPILGAGK